ncbi:tetratricopeptide repeat protein [Verrucomicrobiales bacterium]|nr:tetratricopeptide repeat protein [Verrucomicrobiales bacterium]
MNNGLSSLLLGTCISLILPHSAHSLDLFKRNNGKKILSAEQLSIQEDSADAMLKKAAAYEASGKKRQARDTYKSVSRSYPRTDAGAEGKFNYARLLETDGDGRKAFEQYEDLITNHRNTPRFNEAIGRQFAIAEALRKSDKKGFLGLGAPIQPSQLIEMFQFISTNAPHSDYAPKSLLNIGYVRSKVAEMNEAITAFQSVVDNYSGTSYAKEAQYEIFRLRGVKAEDSESPVMDRAQVEAGLDFVNQNPDDKRANEIKTDLSEIEARSMEKLYKTGMFYENSGKPESARIYYREVIKNPSTQWAGKAQERLNRMDNAPASVNKKAGLFGANPLKKEKVEMRTSADEIVPLAPEGPSAPASE